MRTAAGILMVAFGLFLLITVISELNRYDFNVYDVAFSLFLIIPAAFIITAGVFCLERKYWKVCFASSLLLLVVSGLLLLILWVLWSLLPPYAPVWWMLVPIPVGILPIVFVCLRRREWQKSQA